MAAVLTLGASAAQEPPAAVVLRVVGTVEVQRGEDTPLLAAVGSRLMAGDVIDPDAGSSAVVVTRTGRREEISTPTLLEAGEGAEYGDVFIRTVDVLTQAARGAGRSAPNRQGMIRPLPGVPAHVSPRNGIMVMEAQPRLTWFSVEGAGEYTVQIRQAGEAPQRFTTSDTTLILPRALTPGTTWYWTVGAGRRAAPEDSLRTLSDDHATQLVRALAQLRQLGLDPDGDGRFLKVAVFADLGLHYTALEELEAVEAELGQLSADALLLKGEILDRLGRLDEARAAFDAADAILNP
jgi:hypothetical protein